MNLVDEVWKDRPPVEINPVIVHPLEFAGRSVEEKLKDLRQKLIQEKARGIIFTALDEASLSCVFPRVLDSFNMVYYICMFHLDFVM